VGRGKGVGWWKKYAIHSRMAREFLIVVLPVFQKIIPRNYFVSAQVFTKFNFLL
jgi:hypothetical protein